MTTREYSPGEMLQRYIRALAESSVNSKIYQGPLGVIIRCKSSDDAKKRQQAFLAPLPGKAFIGLKLSV